MPFPWETVPAVIEEPQPPAVEDTVKLLQRDFAYAMTFTAVLVHSDRAELRMLVNTRRGQIVPQGRCRFTDGSTFELQDIGMPQPACPEMTVKEVMAKVWEIAHGLGLTLS